MYKTILILQVWSRTFLPENHLEATIQSDNNLGDKLDDRLIIFTYLVAFSSCVLFNLLDVSLFDIRVNLLGWLLLSAIAGIVNHYEGILLWQKLEDSTRN
jgi:hypothetical protein